MTLREEQALGNTNGAGLTELEVQQKIEALETRIEELEMYCFRLQLREKEHEKTPSPYDLSARRPK